MPSIVALTHLPDEFDLLLQQSMAENFNFLKRLQTEFDSLENTFTKYGEAFYGLYEDGILLAVGGINQQTMRIGRLRRFYVAPQHRREGVGSVLLNHIELNAFIHFESIVLNTDTETASLFYEKHNYRRVSESGITHKKHRVS